MANNLHKKPFLDYQAQIKYLKQKQLVITMKFLQQLLLKKSVTMVLSTDTRIFLKILQLIDFIPAPPLMISIICICLMQN